MAYLKPSMVRPIRVPRFDLGYFTSLSSIDKISNLCPDSSLMAQKTESALKTYGVFEFENHGISLDQRKKMYQSNIDFFQQPLEYKQRIYTKWSKLPVCGRKNNKE